MEMGHWEHFVYIDPEFYRPAEVDYLRGDATKAQAKLGWVPKCDLNRLISLMIDSRVNEKLQNNAGHI